MYTYCEYWPSIEILPFHSKHTGCVNIFQFNPYHRPVNTYSIMEEDELLQELTRLFQRTKESRKSYISLRLWSDPGDESVKFFFTNAQRKQKNLASTPVVSSEVYSSPPKRKTTETLET